MGQFMLPEGVIDEDQSSQRKTGCFAPKQGDNDRSRPGKGG
jgi:hypothetical protein